MTRYTVIFILLITCNAGCKKGDSPPPAPDDKAPTVYSDALLTKDVKWRIHFQGTYLYDTAQKAHYFDSTYHFYTTVESGGYTKSVAGITYYVYPATAIAYQSDKLLFNTPGEYYLRTNASRDTVFANHFFGNVFSYDIPVWNRGIRVGDTVYSGLNPGVIVNCDSMLLGGTYFSIYKTRMPKTNKVYFYCAEGIGLQSGFFKENRGNGGMIRELDFIYNNDSVHFEYDLL